MSARGLLLARARANHQVVTYKSVVLLDQPLAYWPLDEGGGSVIVDASGNGHDGTYNTASPYLVQTAAPLRAGPRYAVQMTGQAYAGGAHYGGFGASGWSLEAIARADSAPFWGCVLAPAGTFSSQGYPGIYYSGGAVDVRCNYGRDASVASPFGTPHHLVGTFANELLSLYVDGALAATLSGYASAGGAAEYYFLGSPSYPDSYGIAGAASDAAIYDHALSAAQVLRHAQVAGFAA